MKQESETLLAEITQRREKAALLLRQSVTMHEAAKGFNTKEQKTDALNMCIELNAEACDVGEEADKLTREFISIIENRK